MTEQIKPCPFCGAQPTLDKSALSEIYRIVCEQCATTHGYSHDHAEVIRSWNRREAKDLLANLLLHKMIVIHNHTYSKKPSIEYIQEVSRKALREYYEAKGEPHE